MGDCNCCTQIVSTLKYISICLFYVVYCKFWELDADHDFKLDRKDLIKYDNHALSYATVDRILNEFAMVSQECQPPNYLFGLDEFFYFLMLDEDKTTDRSIEFWFRVVDLDGDGVIRSHELNFFCSEQSTRMESRSFDVASFTSLMCQFNDMLRPDIPCEFRLDDIKRNRRHSPFFFNSLLSLSKCIAWEHRDPFSHRAEATEFPTFTEWDKYCHFEYDKLSTDDTGEEANEYGSLGNTQDGLMNNFDQPNFGSSEETSININSVNINNINNSSVISSCIQVDGLVAIGSPVADTGIRY